MNKKQILIGISGILVIIIVLITTLSLILNKDNDNEVFMTSVDEEKTSQVGGFLTLMLETEAGSGTYEKSTSSSWPGDDYIFNENLSACENGGKLSWNDEKKAVILNSFGSDACYVYFDKKITLADVCSNGDNLSECIINYYNATGDMDNGLYYHDTDLANGAADNSYRYAGANPNNYVCFGDDCSVEDNLYRIIGVFGSEVKLIKNTSIGNYMWDSSNNTWNSSTKPDIRNTLNTTFLNSLSSTWQNKIATHAFKVGGMNKNDSATAKEYYNKELGSSSSSTTDSMKIGLMYVSDFGFAASNNYWTTALSIYDSVINNNWMYMGLYEWTISRSSVISDSAFALISLGYVAISFVDSSKAVRPSFYLKENVTYVSGDGSKENPIQIDYKQTLTEYVISQYTGTDGDNELYYHNSSLANGAGDYSYRYSGANPNNYVCFGDDCSVEDNLYRIIGVFDNEVKLIKSTSYGDYPWDSGNNNTWDATTKPDIYTTLNDTYYNSLGTTWQNKIATHSYKIGGATYNRSYTAKNYYDIEVGASQSGYEESMKIGLMYVSDYAYAISPDYWTEALDDYDDTTLRSNNWMVPVSNTEWAISRPLDDSSSAFTVSLNGSIGGYGGVTAWRAVRPCFYLTSSTEYVSGSGTQSDPIRIN